MTTSTQQNRIFKKEFWLTENLKYVEPHFRLYKIAKAIGKLSNGRDCELLDIGCGPAALSVLLPDNIHYYGIDIAIHDPAPNLIEMDILNNKIHFRDKKFDLVIASGLFEYLGNNQKQKFDEIKSITKDNGFFVMSYVNFGHVRKRVWPRYSNVQSVNNIKKDIQSYFEIKKIFPTFHYWIGEEPVTRRKKYIQDAQMNIFFCLPIFSSLFALEFIYICKPQV